MKCEKFRFKIFVLLGLIIFNSFSAVPVAVSEGVAICDVKHEEVAGFRFLKGMEISGDPSENILIYEHDQTKMKNVVIPRKYFELFSGGDYNYYLFFRVEDGTMENGLNRNDLKHAVEHSVECAHQRVSFFQRFYNKIFGASDAGMRNASTTRSGIGFECPDLENLEDIFIQLRNPYFKTEEGRGVFKREVKGDNVNPETKDPYTTGRIISEELIKNGDSKFGGFLDEKGHLSVELSKSIDFLSEDKICNVGLPAHSFAYNDFSEKDVYDGVCKILGEMTGNLGNSVLVFPSYVDTPNRLDYKGIMEFVNNNCLSKFEGCVNNGNNHVEKKEGEFKSVPYELVTCGVTGNSHIFDYHAGGKRKRGIAGGLVECDMNKARNLAYLKTNLGNKGLERKAEIEGLFEIPQVNDKVKQLGYECCSASLRILPDKNYMLIKLYGNNDILFSEEKLKDTYMQILGEIKSKNADEIYEQSYKEKLKRKLGGLNYANEFQYQLAGLIENGKKIFETTGGFDDCRLGVVADKFKSDMNYMRDGRFASDPSYVKDKIVSDINESLVVLKDFESCSPEILVLQRPGCGGEKVKRDERVIEQYRNAGSTYEVRLKIKDGVGVTNPAAIYCGLEILNLVGMNSELSNLGLYYGFKIINLGVDLKEGKPEYYLFYPAKEKGGFDEFFNNPDRFKVAVDGVLNSLNDKDFDKYKAELIKYFENGGAKAIEYLRKERCCGLNDMRKMTLEEVRKVIEHTEVSRTEFMQKQ